MKKYVLLFVGLVGTAGGLGGCMDITGRGPAPLMNTIAPVADDKTQQVSLEAQETWDQRPLVGHVYCMRGWLGIFSTGVDVLAEKIDKEVPAVSVADEEWRRLKGFLIEQYEAGRLSDPLVLVGHSWGADDQIRVAQELNAHGIKVDLLVTIDPVTPPQIPANVARVFNIYKSHPGTDAIPFWRGVEIPEAGQEVPITNINLRTAQVGFDTEVIDHINIEKNDNVHEMIIEEIRKVCPPRTLVAQRKKEPQIFQEN